MENYSEQVFEQNEKVNIIVDFEFNCLPRWNQKAEICKILPDVSATTVEAVLGNMVKNGTIKINGENI